MKQICRLDKTNKRPYCLRKPCSYKADGTCSGPVVAIQDYYGLHNCPGDPDPGETPRCGRYARRRTSPRHPPRAGRGSAGLFRACVFLFYQLNPRPSERAGRAEQDPPVSLAHPRPPAADVKKICKTKTAVARPKGTRRQFLCRGEQLCMNPHERKADH